ncbi:MAG: PEP-CTERM sorting domain-containing protein [bacterium]|nr:PEP-CTERM sorting domain-containing protein [bacterium]
MQATTDLHFGLVGGGISAPSSNGGCEAGASLCLDTDQVFELDPGVAPATGYVEYTGVGVGVTGLVDIDVASLGFSLIAGKSAAGGAEAILFTNLNYTGSITSFATGDPTVSFSSAAMGSGAGGITGNYTALDGGGGTVDSGTINATPVLTSLNCTISSGFGQCPMLYDVFTISIAGTDYDFLHAINPIVDPPLPEPSAALLLVLVLAGGAIARRSR